MKLKLLAVASLIAFAPVANALVLTVNSVEYEFSTVETSFETSAALLQSQPWWGSSASAQLFAEAVGDAFPNSNGDWGPLFAYAYDSSAFFGVSSWTFDLVSSPMSSYAGQDYLFAVASPTTTAVPDSASTLKLSLLALLALPWIASRFQRNER